MYENIVAAWRSVSVMKGALKPTLSVREPQKKRPSALPKMAEREPTWRNQVVAV